MKHLILILVVLLVACANPDYGVIKSFETFEGQKIALVEKRDVPFADYQMCWCLVPENDLKAGDIISVKNRKCKDSKDQLIEQ